MQFRFNLTLLRKLHWMSSAACLIGMLLFSITGITLNHAASIENLPKVASLSGQVPKEVFNKTFEIGEEKSIKRGVLSAWLSATYGVRMALSDLEESNSELYFKELTPGSDAWLSIERETGRFEYEKTSKGWVAYANNLHKGRHTGVVWILFMDLFAICCVIFSFTGFLLLFRYADMRKATWPITLGGFLVPLLIILLAVHR